MYVCNASSGGIGGGAGWWNPKGGSKEGRSSHLLTSSARSGRPCIEMEPGTYIHTLMCPLDVRESVCVFVLGLAKEATPCSAFYLLTVGIPIMRSDISILSFLFLIMQLFRL